MTAERRLRHLRDSFGRPYKVINDVRAAQPSPPLTEIEKERARRVASVITNLHIYDATRSKSALK